MTTALNVFKTVTHVVSTNNAIVYTAPANYTGIVLMAQITNVSGNSANVTFAMLDGVTETELLKDYTIPANDAAAATTGKLIIETGKSIKIQASANNKLKATLSILESANE